MTYGFILVSVWILSSGDITGEALNWYDNPTSCWEEAIRMKENSKVGIGYVCVEDTGAET
tara:strand:- start:139 stop:318 length:180 start_codon:yes stop_codon:yes gene_type:complete